jgi:outer membrane protein OmpA-like peptidoglycan-associated protein
MKFVGKISLLVIPLLVVACSDDAVESSATASEQHSPEIKQSLPSVPRGSIDRDDYRDLKRALRDQPKRVLTYPEDDSGPTYDNTQLTADAIAAAVASDDIEQADKILALADPKIRLETWGLLKQREFDAEGRDDYASAYRLKRYLHLDQFAFWRLDTATIRGHVYQAVTRAPVAGATVKTQYDGAAETRSDADGAYELIVKSGLPLTLLVEHPDHQKYPIKVSTAEGPVELNFKLSPRSALVANIELEPSATATPVESGVTVRGQMIDLDSQQPIADMEVSVVVSGRELSGDFSALTDTEGLFEIADLPVGTHFFLARKSNPIYQHSDELFMVAEGDTLRRIEAQQVQAKKVDIPVWIVGYVRDRDTGLPIAKAKVSGGTYQSTRTDDEGWFRLELATGEEWNIQATHEWYHESAIQSFSSPKPTRFETEYLLDPITTGTIIGVAIDAITGQPLTRATIKIAGQTVTTDAQGRFRLEEIEAGEVSVSAGQDGYRANAQTIELEALKTSEAKIVLEPITEGTIEGTVVDSATGRPLDGVRITAAGQQALSDMSGTFLLENVEKGDVEVAATKAVYERAVMSAEVIAQETTTLSIPLTPITYGTLTGTVVDAANGQPLPSATVSLASTTLQTDAAGEFVVEKVPAGNVLVLGSYDRYYDGKQAVILKAAGEASVTVSLQPITTGTVRGVVRNASSGAPIPGATVNIGRLAAKTDANGSYEITDIPAGDLMLAVDARLYESNRKDAALEVATELTVDLQLVPITYGQIAGTVVDASTKKAISDARVKVGKKTAISDSDGAFRFEKITAGDLTIATTKPIYRDDSRPARLAAGASMEVSIELQPITTGTLRGIVRNKADAQPIAGAKVTVGRLTVTSDNTGAYVLENVPAGAVQLGAAMVLFEPSSKDVRVAPADDVRANLELTPITYGTLAGTVIDTARRRPIPGARVAVGGKQTVTDSKGRYEIERVAAGSISVTATKAVYIDGSEKRELIAGDALTVDLELQPITWGALAGQVVDAETGAPISDADVSVAGQQLKSNRDGRFSIETITAGALAIQASKKSYSDGSLSLKLAPDGSADATIRLEPIKVGTVRGQVLDAKTGEVVAQARVSIGGKSTETDSAGSFSFTDIGIGRVLVSGRHADYADGGAYAVLEGGQAAEVTIRLNLRREDVTNLEAALASEGTIDLYGIYFDSGRDQFKPSSLSTLRAVLEVMKRAPERRFEIAGHTDSDGADSSNQNLSERRAKTVIRWLVENGIEANRIDATGFGETQPAAPNDSASGKALNRRVQLSFSN